MGNRIDQAPYIGILVPDDRIKTENLRANTGATGNSDYTQAGPRPGVPEFDQDEVALTSATAGDYSPSMAMEALGEQDSSTDYHIKALKGGFPSRDATVVRRDSLTTGDWRGWNTANVPGHLEAATRITRASVSQVSYASVTLPNNQALFAYWSASAISCRPYDPETGTFGSTVTVMDWSPSPILENADISAYEDPATDSHRVLDLVVLPTGRVICYFLTNELGSGATTLILWAAYSDDNGATWRTGQYLALDAPLDVTSRTVHKLRAEYSGGYVLLIIEKTWTVDQTPYRGGIQYASDDTGLNFELIRDDETESSTDNNSHHEILADPVTGAFVVIYEHDSSNFLRRSRLGNPYTPYTSGDTGIIQSSVAPTNVAAYSEPGGWMYATYDTSDGIDLWRSRDAGVTWTQVEEPWNWNDTDAAWSWTITHAAGRAVWFMNMTASAGTPPDTDAFFAQEVGGWNTLCQHRVLGTDPTLSRGFGSTTAPEAGTWLPADKPESFGWTLVGTTKAVNGVGSWGLPLVTDVTHYQITPTATHSVGLICYFGLFVNSGGSVSADEVGVKMLLGGMQVHVRFSTTEVRLYDAAAPATISTTSVDMTSEKVFKCAIRKIAAGAIYAATLYQRDIRTDSWTTLGTTVALGTSGSTDQIDWGMFVDTADCEWTFFHWVAESGNGDQNSWTDDLAQDVISRDPYAMYGAPLPAPPFKRYVDQGLFIRGTGGPATRGDTYKIEPRFDHPITAIDWRNDASPDRGWRSVDDSAAQVIAWDMTLDSTLGNESIGLFLGGINFGSALFQGWNGAAWVTLGTLTANTGLTSLPVAVTGDTASVDTGSSVDGRYIAYGEFVGGTIVFNGGETRRIVWNSEGVYTDNLTKRPQFRFEGGAIGAHATCELWHPSALLLVHEHTTIYDRYAVRIPIQTTYDGDFRIGVVLVGGMAMFGRKYARGRTITTTPNYAMTQDEAGHRRARELGDVRRSVVMSWSEVDLTAVSGASPNPDYISLRSNAAAGPVADRFSTPLLMEGLIRELQGGVRPCVYVPHIAATTADANGDETRLSGREDYVYGRLVDASTRTAVLGTESQDEVVTFTGVRFEEEV